MKFVIDITLYNEKASEVEPDQMDKYYPHPNAWALADLLQAYLCDGGEGNIEYPEWIKSVDNCEPVPDA